MGLVQFFFFFKFIPEYPSVDDSNNLTNSFVFRALVGSFSALACYYTVNELKRRRRRRDAYFTHRLTELIPTLCPDCGPPVAGLLVITVPRYQRYHARGIIILFRFSK